MRLKLKSFLKNFKYSVTKKTQKSFSRKFAYSDWSHLCGKIEWLDALDMKTESECEIIALRLLGIGETVAL